MKILNRLNFESNKFVFLILLSLIFMITAQNTAIANKCVYKPNLNGIPQCGSYTSNCVNTTMFTTDRGNYYFYDSIKTTLIEDPLGKMQTNCFINSGLTTPLLNNPLNCTGNDLYCSNNLCGSNPCYCETRYLLEQKYIYVLGSFHLITNYQYEPICNIFQRSIDISTQQTKSQSKRYIENKNYYAMKRGLLSENITSIYCQISLHDNMVSVFSSSSDVSLMNLQIGDRLVTTSFNKLYTIILTETEISSNIKIIANIITPSNEACQASFVNPGHTFCKLADCILCYEVFSSLTCLPFTYKIVVLVWILFILLLIICFVPFLLTLLWVIFWVILSFIKMLFCFFYKFHHTRIYNNCKSKMSRVVDNIYYNFTPLKTDNHTQSNYKPNNPVIHNNNNHSNNAPFDYRAAFMANNRPDTDDPKRYFNIYGNPQTTSFYFVALMTCIVLSSATTQTNCVNTSVFSATSLVCTRNVNTETCSIEFDELISIPNIGTSYCANIVDSSNKILGHIEISYDSLKEQRSLTYQYATSSWWAMTESASNCYGAGGCDSSVCNSCCLTRDANGKLTNGNVIYRPGRSLCHSRCGCAGCGCFYCVSGCTYSGYGLNPTGPIFTVRSIDTPIFSSFITLTLTLGDSVYTHSMHATSTPFSFNNFTITRLGSFNPSSTVFNNFYVISNVTHFFLSHASTPSQPIKGTIGDIQANLPDYLSNPDATSFIFDTSIANVQYGDDIDTYTFNSPGLDLNLPMAISLPGLYQSNIWIYDDNYSILYSNHTSSDSLLLTLSSTSPVTFTRLVDTVCPIGTFINITGCYQCVSGFTIYVSLKSDCLPGPIYLESNDQLNDPTIQTTSISITTQFNIYEIHGFTNDADSNFNLIYSSGIYNINIPVRGQLLFVPTVRNDSTTISHQNNTNLDNSTSFKWMLDDIINDIMSGKATIYSYILLVVYSLLSVAGVIVFVVVFYKIITYLMFKKTKTV